MKPIEEVSLEAHMKWLEKAETAKVNGSEMTVLPYGYLETAIKEILEERDSQWLKRIEELVPKALKRDYDGNNLYEAGSKYGMAAESWPEIIRYEYGHEACRQEILNNLKKINT